MTSRDETVPADRRVVGRRASQPAVHRVLVLNGPNLGRLGKREPSVYGTATYADLSDLCRRVGQELGLDAEVRQTEYEGELVTWIHEACDNATPVVLNAGALTHYSYALMDAVKMRTAPLVEVHISNLAAREGFRHESVITGAATGIIAGFGFQSYVLALRAIAAELSA
jgi:3-dehydroquinate dehydratase-2